MSITLLWPQRVKQMVHTHSLFLNPGVAIRKSTRLLPTYIIHICANKQYHFGDKHKCDDAYA